MPADLRQPAMVAQTLPRVGREDVSRAQLRTGWRKTRISPFWRMLALAMAVGGLIAYRWDTNLSGLLVVVSYLPGAPTVGYTSYHPSWIEYLSGLGIGGYGALALS